MDFDNIKLVDIGNTNAKILYKKQITILSANDFDDHDEFYYICVNKKINEKLKQNKQAINLEKYINIKTSYKGLGIDRKILCSYIEDGIIVDAGSAITIDVMDEKNHLGGYILPGIANCLKIYENISSVLKVDKIDPIMIDKLPDNTTDAISKAILKSVILMIKDVSKDKKIYFCGGDGLMISSYFENAIYKQDLIFDAMKKIIKENIC